MNTANEQPSPQQQRLNKMIKDNVPFPLSGSPSHPYQPWEQIGTVKTNNEEGILNIVYLAAEEVTDEKEWRQDIIGIGNFFDFKSMSVVSSYVVSRLSADKEDKK